MAQYIRRPQLEVLINNARVPALSAEVTLSSRSGVSTASAQLDPRVRSPYPGDAVIIRMGFGGALQPVFTGTIDDDGLAYWPYGITMTCVGVMNALTRPIGVPPLPGAQEVDIDGEPVPVRTWPAAAGDPGVTDDQIVKDILTMYGVPFDAAGIAGRGALLGTVEPIRLDRTGNGMDIIRQLDEAFGYRTYDGPDGVVRRSAFNGIPTGKPSLALTQGVNLLSGSRSRSIREVINRVNVTGVENPDFTPRATVQADSKTSPTTGRPYVPDPPKYNAENFSSSILDTAALCEEYAARVVGERNRLRESVSVSLAYGNSSLRPGVSLFVNAAKLGLGSGMAFFVDEVRHRMSNTAYYTDLVLGGAYTSEGVNPDQAPIAAFTYMVDKEYLGPTNIIWVILADGSSSNDPDGAFSLPAQPEDLSDASNPKPATPEVNDNGIVRYVWTSTLGVAPNITAGGKRASFIATTDPVGQTITLTVYDANGNMGAITKTIGTGPTKPILTRDLWAAVTNELLLTIDGGKTWDPIAVPAVGVCRMAADTFNLAWDAGGTLYRILADKTFTTPASAPTNVSAAYIRWKFPDTVVTGERCWLGTVDGRVFFSPDSGQTWELKSTVPGGAQITSITESPYAENDITVTSGNKLLHSFDGVAWDTQYEHTNTGLTAAGFTSGFDSGFVVFKGPQPATAPENEASRVRERDNKIKGDWNKSAASTGLAAGTWQVSYAYRAAGGETLPSPAASITLTAGQAISVAAITPLPSGANGVLYYLSSAAGSTTMRLVKTESGVNAVVLDTAPIVGSLAPATLNSTTAKVPNPQVAPALTAVAGTAGDSVDWPAQPNAVTIGVYEPFLYTVGTAADGTGQAWWADAKASFTFKRGPYPNASLGVPRDAIRDGNLEGIIYGAADTGLFKTVDGFQNTCFELLDLVAPRAGKMIGYGKLRGADAAKGDLVASVWDTDTTLANSAIIALTASGWALRSTMPPIWNEVALGTTGIERPLRRIAANTYIVWTSPPNGVAAANLNPVNNAARSTDGGVTWTVITALNGVFDVTSAPDGVCYAIGARAADTKLACRIFRSADAGATWAEVFTNPFMLASSNVSNQEMYVAAAVDPNNSQCVALKSPGGGNGNHAIATTRDGFTSYTVYPLQPDAVFTWQTAGMQGSFAGGNFLMLTGPNANNASLYRVTFGGSATLLIDSAVAGSLVIQNNRHAPSFASYGLTMYLLQKGTLALLRSTDDGTTWESYYSTATQNPAQRANPGAHGVVYDSTADTVYVGHEDIRPLGTAVNPTSFVALRPGMDPAATWEDLTPGLFTKLGKRWRSYRGGMQPG